MSLVRVGNGFWIPNLGPDYLRATTATGASGLGSALLDADEEELQFLGRVYLAGGSGSKTFGTSGSKISWLPGIAQTFQATATLRVGVKQSSSWTDASGPPGRATVGAAAFDVYHDLVGGTDTITASTWRNDSMSAGTGFTVTHGDRLAVCFHIDITANAQAVRIARSADPSGAQTPQFPVTTMVTNAGVTFTAQSGPPIIVLTFDDGTIGWIDGSFVVSAPGASEAVGNTNIYGNIVNVPFGCKVDGIAAVVSAVGTTNFDIGLWTDPLGTPLASQTVSIDPQNMSSGSAAIVMIPFPTEITLNRNTDYAYGVMQNSASGITIYTYDVGDTSHLQINGLGAGTYAAKSTAGAAFAAQNSGKRRMAAWLRVSQVEDGVVSDGGGRAAFQLGI